MKRAFVLCLLLLLGCNELIVYVPPTQSGSRVTLVGLLALDGTIGGGLEGELTVEPPLIFDGCTNPVQVVNEEISAAVFSGDAHSVHFVSIPDDILAGWQGGLHVFSCDIIVPLGTPSGTYKIVSKAKLGDNSGRDIYVKAPDTVLYVTE